MIPNQEKDNKGNATKSEQALNHPLFHGKGEETQSPSLWLITFTDIMALMLTFFVLLYSMSVPEEEKWEDIIESVNSGFSKFESPPKFTGALDTIAIDKLNFSDALNLDYLKSIIEDTIAKDEKLKGVIVIPQSDRLIISLPQDLLFESGKDEVGANGKRTVFTLGGLLERIQNRIEVIGHTDPNPISDSTEGFNSNWNLSLARAAQVANILLQVGYRRPITVRGVSSARFDELPQTIDEDLRYDLSRRVDIVVMRDDGAGLGALRLE